MLREKIDWLAEQIGSFSRELLSLFLAILLNELRKFFWSLILNALGLKFKGVITMQKAYDLNDLVQKLKARGLDVAEEGAKVIVEETSGWIVESAALSENKIDDVVALGMPHLQKLALGLVDKIDGKEG